MLGRLARWLRAVGCDALYDPHADDAAIARLGRETGRIVLTRDRGLVAERDVAAHILLVSDRPLEQLRQVVELYAIDWRAGLFTRCTVCNGALVEVARDSLAGEAPARVLEEQQRFLRCVGCRRLYWHGSHARRMRMTLDRALGRGGS